MQTTRNPKVLNNVLKYKLRPILDKISSLETIQEDNETYIESVKSQVDSMKESATEQVEEYDTEHATLDTVLTKANQSLTNLIKNTLYNPNSTTVSTGITVDTEESTETKYISDKTVEAACYGFVIDGEDYSIFSSTGKGIVICDEDDDKQTTEFTFLNPGDSSTAFPSYYVNDILLVDTDNAIMSSNNGVVLYSISTGNYSLIDKSYGLPNSKVYRVVKVATSDSSIQGYMALTENGIAYSPNGRQWTTVDSDFTEACTSASKTNLIDTPQNLLFIGTNSGIYYIDIDDFLVNDVRTVKAIPGLNLVIPTVYINGLAYDTTNDILSIVSLSGLSVVNHVTELIESGSTLTTSLKNSENELYYKVYTSAAGLNTSSCYDAIYTVDNKLVICTSNGLNVTSDYDTFSSITKSANTYDSESGEKLNNYICNKIIRRDSNNYTVLHGTGFTENIHI